MKVLQVHTDKLGHQTEGLLRQEVGNVEERRVEERSPGSGKAGATVPTLPSGSGTKEWLAKAQAAVFCTESGCRSQGQLRRRLPFSPEAVFPPVYPDGGNPTS